MCHQLENQWTRNSVLLMGLYYALAENIHTCNLLFPWNILWRDIVIIDPFWFLLEQNGQGYNGHACTYKKHVYILYMQIGFRMSKDD